MESIFFKHAEPIIHSEEELDYSATRIIPHLFDCISDLVPHNAFVVDYYRKDFFSITKDSIMLCGYSHEEAIGMGYSFFEKILEADELRMMDEVNQAGFKLFYGLSEDKRRDGYIAYNLRLRHRDGTCFYASHRFKPLCFTPDGNIWLAVCTLQPALNDASGNVLVNFKASSERQRYSFEDKRWHALPRLELSKAESVVALETDKGTPEKIISDMLGCTRSNIQYHKSRILIKTQCATIRESVIYLKYLGVL